MDEDTWRCQICGDVDLDSDQMIVHFNTAHPFLAALVNDYARFEPDDPRGMAWLN